MKRTNHTVQHPHFIFLCRVQTVRSPTLTPAQRPLPEPVWITWVVTLPVPTYPGCALTIPGLDPSCCAPSTVVCVVSTRCLIDCSECCLVCIIYRGAYSGPDACRTMVCVVTTQASSTAVSVVLPALYTEVAAPQLISAAPWCVWCVHNASSAAESVVLLALYTEVAAPQLMSAAPWFVW